MSIVVKFPSLEYWEKARAFFDSFSASPWAKRLNISYEMFQKYYLAAMVNSKVGVIFVEQHEEIVGASVVQEVIEWAEDKTVPRAFIRGTFMDPRKATRAASDAMNRALEEWACDHQHDMVIAYTRLPKEGPLNQGFRLSVCQQRYGFEPLYTVIGKKVGRKEGSQDHGQE